MGIPFSLEISNAREEVESTDLVRAQLLASREAQGVLRHGSNTDDDRDPTTGVYGQGRGTPQDSYDTAPFLTAIPATFTMRLSEFQAFFDDTFYAPGADDSAYTVVRLNTNTVLTFTTPDATNPRIDLIVATPGTQNVDLASRNILVDPVLRTVIPQNVPKTQNPNATITVVTGTPAASNPVAPAVPSDTMPLFEVKIPPAAGDSTSFVPIRRAWRRQVGLAASAHGIVKGVRIVWNGVGDETVSTALVLQSLDTTDTHKVVIDGEIISWMGSGSSATSVPVKMVFQDTSNNPFGSAAPAGNDKPYYLYLVGGKHAPQGSTPVTGYGFAPVVLVESLTAPDRDGRPSAAIAHPRGGTTRAGALYVGIGFVVKNTTNRKSCRIVDDWVWAWGGQISAQVGAKFAGFNDTSPRTLANSVTNHTINTKPGPSTQAWIHGRYTQSVPTSFISVGHFNGVDVIADAHLVGDTVQPDDKIFCTDITTPILDVTADPVFATGGLELFAIAYNMLVPRLGHE